MAKSQMQITETIIVLAVFFILAALLFGFYSNTFLGRLEKEHENAVKLEAITVAQRISFLPELQCSKKGIAINGCIDTLKLRAFASLASESNRTYFTKFGFSTITVKEIYPFYKEIVLYNQTLPAYSYMEHISIPVSVFYPLEEEYSFAVISIEKFSK